jgi:hypothetical protein
MPDLKLEVYVGVKEIARFLKLHWRTCARHLRDGKIPAKRDDMGRWVLFSLDYYRSLKDPQMYNLVRDTPTSILRQASREFGRLKLTLLWLHAFEEPFYSREDLESLARASRFKKGLTRFVGVLCGLVLQKATI